MIESAGLNPTCEMANLREQCRWVHINEPEAATAKAVDLVRMAVARAARLVPLQGRKIPLSRRTLVIGGGIQIQAALDLADSGYEVVLVEKSPRLAANGKIRQDLSHYGLLDLNTRPKMTDAGRHPEY